MSDIKIEGYGTAEEVPYEGTYIYVIEEPMSKVTRKQLARDIAKGNAYLIAYIKETPEAVKELLGQEGLDEYNKVKENFVTERQRRSDAAKRGWKARRRKQEAEAAIRFAAFGE